MTYVGDSQASALFERCRYDGSKLLLRGPRRDLDGAFVACLGGTETYGRFVAKPYPDLLEEKLGVTCVNFGWPNAGVDVFANDTALLDCASRSRLCILQVPGALNMSNMYYRVHPRRNDRVLEATDALRELFPGTDFTDFSFTRHMLSRLRMQHSERFSYVVRELSTVWLNGMERLLNRIEAPVVLLWVSLRQPDKQADLPTWQADPALVSRKMLQALEPHVLDLVELRLSAGAHGVQSGDGKSRAAEAALGAEAHHDIAEALFAALSPALEQDVRRPA